MIHSSVSCNRNAHGVIFPPDFVPDEADFLPASSRFVSSGRIMVKSRGEGGAEFDRSGECLVGTRTWNKFSKPTYTQENSIFMQKKGDQFEKSQLNCPLLSVPLFSLVGKRLCVQSPYQPWGFQTPPLISRLRADNSSGWKRDLIGILLNGPLVLRRCLNLLTQ